MFLDLVDWLRLFFSFIKDNKDTGQNIPAVKAIIVLGSGVENGQPSAILAKRLDTAAPVALSQPHAKVVLTGGLDFSEKESEALVMSRYLEQHFHIAKERMILEDKSTSTELNLKTVNHYLSKLILVLINLLQLLQVTFIPQELQLLQRNKAIPIFIQLLPKLL